jgi:hypothetical protein
MVVYFSNMLSDVGFEVITTVKSSLHYFLQDVLGRLWQLVTVFYIFVV